MRRYTFYNLTAHSRHPQIPRRCRQRYRTSRRVEIYSVTDHKSPLQEEGTPSISLAPAGDPRSAPASFVAETDAEGEENSPAEDGAPEPFALFFEDKDPFDGMELREEAQALFPDEDADEEPGQLLTDDGAGFDEIGPQDAPAGDSANAAPHKLFGVRFRSAGQVYFFTNTGLIVRPGTKVIVELEQGLALGEIVSLLEQKGAPAEALPGTVTGLATAQDIAADAENHILRSEASAFCKTCIRQRNLDMKLVDVEVLHDRSKIIFFFTAPARIDFRELVKDLVRMYRTRIELRQIGVRHETQMVGGLGNCGMVCCCHRYLRKFAPVTIKMAKEQNLFLNPAKLSGMCGRLLCCLSFEQSNYEEFNGRCPKLGKKYVTARGNIKVLRANMFSQSIIGVTDAGDEVEFTLEEWESLQPRRMEHAPHDGRGASGGSHHPAGESSPSGGDFPVLEEGRVPRSGRERRTTPRPGPDRRAALNKPRKRKRPGSDL